VDVRHCIGVGTRACKRCGHQWITFTIARKLRWDAIALSDALRRARELTGHSLRDVRSILDCLLPAIRRWPKNAIAKSKGEEEPQKCVGSTSRRNNSTTLSAGWNFNEAPKGLRLNLILHTMPRVREGSSRINYLNVIHAAEQRHFKHGNGASTRRR